MPAEGSSRLRSKGAYRLVLLSIKVLPVLLAALAMLTTALDILMVDTTVINYAIMGCLVAFMYLVSHVFRFCACHRMFLHYFAAMNCVSMYDSLAGIPLDNWRMAQLYALLTGVCLLATLYLHVRSDKKTAGRDNGRHRRGQQRPDRGRGPARRRVHRAHG